MKLPLVGRPAIALAAVLVAAASFAQDGYRVPPRLDDGWPVAGAATQGMSTQRLAALTAALRAWPELGVHAVLVERAGKLVYEEYFDGFDEAWGRPLGRVTMTRETRHDLRSVTKSVVSALVGIAIAEGAIASADTPLVSWFPEFPELDTPDRRRITLAHALGMTAGLAWNEEIPYNDPRNDEIRMSGAERPLHYALSRPIVAAPGEEFTYNGGLTQVLAAVLQRSTRTPLLEYAKVRLFAPLGVTDVEWLGDLAGMPAAASGLRLRARDLAKFGSLYLHGGRWNAQQVIPADWVERSTRRRLAFRPWSGAPAGDAAGYAWQWWYSGAATPAGQVEVRAAVGNGQQLVAVMPGADVVVTIYAGRYNDFSTGVSLARRIVREHVAPAIVSGLKTGCPGA